MMDRETDSLYIKIRYWIWIKEEGNMGKDKGKRDVSPDKKPGPLTKKERKARKKKRKEKHILRWIITQILY